MEFRLKPAKVLRMGSKEYEEIDASIDEMKERGDFEAYMENIKIDIFSIYEHGKSCYNKPILTVYLGNARRLGVSINSFILPTEETDASEACEDESESEDDDRKDMKL